MRSIPRVAWLSAETPDAGGSGGQRRQFHQISALARAGLDVHVATLDGPQSDASLRSVVPVTRFPSSRLDRRIRHGSRELTSFLVHRAPDAVVIAHIESLPYVQRAVIHYDLPWALDFHNVWSRWYDMTGASDQAEAWRRLETRALGAASFATCCSEQERVALISLVQSARVETAPHGVEPAEWPADALAEHRRPDVAIFGTWTHAPNRDGAAWFLAEVWPTIKSRVPSASVLLSGPGDPPSPTPGVGGVENVGRVDDLASFLGKVRVVAVPIVRGVGARMKFPEALASGAAVVSTALGAEGFEAEGRFVEADAPCAFADACIRFLTNEPEARRIGDSARRWALRTLSWHNTTAALTRWCHSPSSP
jgi:polysaccharide biosynthesis protein PslH